MGNIKFTKKYQKGWSLSSKACRDLGREGEGMYTAHLQTQKDHACTNLKSCYRNTKKKRFSLTPMKWLKEQEKNKNEDLIS